MRRICCQLNAHYPPGEENLSAFGNCENFLVTFTCLTIPVIVITLPAKYLYHLYSLRLICRGEVQARGVFCISISLVEYNCKIDTQSMNIQFKAGQWSLSTDKIRLGKLKVLSLFCASILVKLLFTFEFCV